MSSAKESEVLEADSAGHYLSKEHMEKLVHEFMDRADAFKESRDALKLENETLKAENNMLRRSLEVLGIPASDTDGEAGSAAAKDELQVKKKKKKKKKQKSAEPADVKVEPETGLAEVQAVVANAAVKPVTSAEEMRAGFQVYGPKCTSPESLSPQADLEYTEAKLQASDAEVKDPQAELKKVGVQTDALETSHADMQTDGGMQGLKDAEVQTTALQMLHADVQTDGGMESRQDPQAADVGMQSLQEKSLQSHRRTVTFQLPDLSIDAQHLPYRCSPHALTLPPYLPSMPKSQCQSRGSLHKQVNCLRKELEMSQHYIDFVQEKHTSEKHALQLKHDELHMRYHKLQMQFYNFQQHASAALACSLP